MKLYQKFTFIVSGLALLACDEAGPAIDSPPGDAMGAPEKDPEYLTPASIQYQNLSVLGQARYESSVMRAKQLIADRDELRGSQIANLVELRRPDSGEVYRLEFKLSKNDQPAGFLITNLGPNAVALLYSGEGLSMVESEVLKHAAQKKVARVFQYGGLSFALESDQGEFVSMSDEGTDAEDWRLTKEEWMLHAPEIDELLAEDALPPDSVAKFLTGGDGGDDSHCPAPKTYLPKNDSVVPAWDQFRTKRVFECLIGCGPLAIGQLLAWAQKNMGEDIQVYDPANIYGPPSSKNANGKIIEEIGRHLQTKCVLFTDAAYTNYLRPKRFRRTVRKALREMNRGSYRLGANISYRDSHSGNLKTVAKELKEERRPSVVFGWSPFADRKISNQHIYIIDGHKDGCSPEYRYNKGHGRPSVWAAQHAFFFQLIGSIQLTNHAEP